MVQFSCTSLEGLLLWWVSQMDDFLEDYVAFEWLEESLCEATDVICPDCESSLLYDSEREVYLCPACRGEFAEGTG